MISLYLRINITAFFTFTTCKINLWGELQSNPPQALILRCFLSLSRAEPSKRFKMLRIPLFESMKKPKRGGILSNIVGSWSHCFLRFGIKKKGQKNVLSFSWDLRSFPGAYGAYCKKFPAFFGRLRFLQAPEIFPATSDFFLAPAAPKIFFLRGVPAKTCLFFSLTFNFPMPEFFITGEMGFVGLPIGKQI